MKIQHKIIALPLAVMTLVCTLSTLVVERYLGEYLLENNKKELSTLASASLESIKNLTDLGNKNDEDIIHLFQRLAENFAHTGDFRLTYIDANGKVLGDSKISFDQTLHVENHADRQEVQQALSNDVGISERFSSTLNTVMLYVAVRSKEAHITSSNDFLAHPIIARVSRSEFSIQVAINELRRTLLFTGVISLITVLIMGLLASRAMNKAVQREQHLLEKRVHDRTNEISMLQTFGALLNACSTLNEAGEVICNVLPKLIPNSTGSISIIKSSRNRLDCFAHWGNNWTGADRFSPSECWALRKGHQHFSTEHGIQTHCQHWIEQGSEQTLCIPLLAQGETMGVLHFVLPYNEDNTTHKNIRNAIAEQIGLTLANIQLRDNLREQAIRDPLTGLFNRRYMLEAIDQASARAERSGEKIAVMMLDLDHFKLFNDNFGHDAGDHVLKAFAQLLKTSLRQEDIACRYGGEEFCIVCPSANEQQTLQIANRVIKSVRALELNINQLSLGTVTTSIGIAIYPHHSNSMEELLTYADEALYIAKERGRDRVEVYQQASSSSKKKDTTTIEAIGA